jgi:hypothetical protein
MESIGTALDVRNEVDHGDNRLRWMAVIPVLDAQSARQVPQDVVPCSVVPERGQAEDCVIADRDVTALQGVGQFRTGVGSMALDQCEQGRTAGVLGPWAAEVEEAAQHLVPGWSPQVPERRGHAQQPIAPQVRRSLREEAIPVRVLRSLRESALEDVPRSAQQGGHKLCTVRLR